MKRIKSLGARKNMKAFFVAGGACLALCLFVSVGSASGINEDKVVIVGLDAMRNSVSTEIPAEEYRRNLTSAFGSVHDSILPVLHRHQAQEKPPSGGWHLNAIGVGVGLSGTVGLGPIVNITPSAQIRLVFTNSKAPIYPN